MRAKAIKVGSWDKHPAYCLDLEGAFNFDKEPASTVGIKWVTYNRGQNLLRNCGFCASTLKKTPPGPSCSKSG